MRVSNALRLLVFALLAVLLMSACGGAGSSNEADGGEESQSQDSEPSEAGSDGDFDTPDIDPSSMPPPGEARVEVDGETFVFRQADMLEGPFTCEIRDNGVTINFQSDRHDLLLQGAVTPDGELIATTTVSPEESDNKYTAQNAGGAGAVAAEAPHLVFVADFSSYPKDDPASFNDAGTGTIRVTCP